MLFRSNVTKRVLSAAKHAKTESERRVVVDSVMNVIGMEVSEKDWYVVGGGGCLIRNFGTYDKSRVTIIDDICATAKGYESLAYMSLKRRG